MKFPVVFIVAICGFVNAGFISTTSDEKAVGSTATKGKNYNLIVSSGLKSIAEGSANQAHSAVAQQIAAANQASFLAKTTLAQSAVQAAATAHTARAGKQLLLENLERQVADAESALNGEQQQLEIAQQAAERADAAVQLALQHVNALTSTVNSAQQVLQQVESNAQIMGSIFASQTESSSLAQSRYYSLVRELENVRADFEATKEAAEKASQAAQTAQSNAADAGEIVQQELESISTGTGWQGRDSTAPSGWLSNDIFHQTGWTASNDIAGATVWASKDKSGSS